MSKRKTADDPIHSDSDGAKKPRTEGAAAAAEDAADSDGSFEADLTRANLAPRIATQTLKLVDAIKAFGDSWTQRMQAVVDLLQADAARPESLLDLSLVVQGETVSGHSRR